MLNFGNKEFRNLQEQVLQNARDIATLKGIKNLQIVIVEELPEEGNPYYIYLVPSDGGEDPDVYEEYIWLADEERYEKIGGVSIDLTNLVTLDTAQTITAIKTHSADVVMSGSKTDYDGKASVQADGNVLLLKATSNVVLEMQATGCLRHNYQNAINRHLGASNYPWGDVFASGKYYFGEVNGAHPISERNWNIFVNNYDELVFARTYNSIDADQIHINGGSIYSYGGAASTLGTNTRQWGKLYLSGELTDGVNTIIVANIASKVTSSYASGTFDANGEDTIDISDGTPEGLFVFAYGNCQCFVRLTATMVQNADLSPIRVACPMIYNSGTVNGWLNISRSSDTLTISVIDGTNHVDSGYAWTLTKTNLI